MNLPPYIRFQLTQVYLGLCAGRDVGWIGAAVLWGFVAWAGMIGDKGAAAVGVLGGLAVGVLAWVLTTQARDVREILGD